MMDRITHCSNSAKSLSENRWGLSPFAMSGEQTGTVPLAPFGSRTGSKKPTCRYRFALFVFGAFAVAVTAAAKASGGNESGGSVTTDEIRHWVCQLGSDDFGTREEATVRLARAGFVAIQPVTAAAMTDDLEVACRSVEVLRQLLNSEELATGDAAADALTKIAESPSGSASDLAADVLGDFQDVRQSRAIDEIKRLGGSVTIGNLDTGNVDGIIITLGATWTGKSSDLKLLRRIPDLERLSIHGVGVSDDDLKQLEGFDRLRWVDLFGSKVSADGAARLARMYPGIRVDRRSSAKLGVAGHSEPAGCRIVIVEPNSPAEKAGIATDDFVVKFQDQMVADFESLTTMIGSRSPGDKVIIEVRRGSDLLKKEVELGAWK
ncbi:MAG TPA: PDZ domain-containing protein [Pirellulales bacterium]|nr:PDZ domain-containing protein [Pirellulales bacterium]